MPPSWALGNPSGPGGPGQGQRDADSCRALPQGSLRNFRDSVPAEDPSGVCLSREDGLLGGGRGQGLTI